MLKKQYSKSKPTCKVTFSLPKEAAPSANEIKVLGDFNNWSWEDGIKMNLQGTDYAVDVTLDTGKEYHFRYLIDQQTWENDYQADRYEPSQFGGVDNSVLVLDAQELAKKAAKKVVTKTKNTVKKAAKATVKKEKPQATAAKPKKAKATTAKPKKAKKAKKDSLRKIEGIGPKIEGLLQDAGIVTFDDLAKAKVAKVKEILASAGSRYKMHDPTTWMEQAALAAAGEWDKLAVLQEELKGGKRK